MSGKKVPHLLNTEELLEVAEAPIEETKPESELDGVAFDNQTNDVLSFLSVFNILDGDQRIKRTTLYSIYKAWSLTPLPRNEFHREACKYVASGGSHAPYYNINQNSIKLTYDAYQNFKKTKSRTKSKAWVQRIQDFLSYHAITEGEYLIEIDILYFLYDKFEYERGNTDGTMRLSKKYFEKILDVFLKNKLTEKSKLYAVSTNIQNFFQPGQLARMKKTYAVQEKKKYKKRNKKKQASTS